MLDTLKLLLPAIVPSWRFFDEIAASPRIEFVLLQSGQHPQGDWHEFRPRPARVSVGTMLKRLFWNQRWNESLFLASCAERLMQHPTEHSHQEILKRIRAELAHGTGTLAPFLQYRLVFVGRQGNELQRQVTYVSPIAGIAPP